MPARKRCAMRRGVTEAAGADSPCMQYPSPGARTRQVARALLPANTGLPSSIYRTWFAPCVMVWSGICTVPLPRRETCEFRIS
jgi:hypothetical protein